MRVTPFDSGNYTCVPSYAIPAWINIVVLPGTPINLFKIDHFKNDFFFSDASQAEYDGVSEVKVDTSTSDVLKLYPYHWCLNFLITLLMK